MLNLHNDRLVVEEKGIYSIEKFLVARRLMYWQVYLHKTSVASEKMLTNILKRAKELASNGEELFAPASLRYFLYNRLTKADFETSLEPLDQFADLDDADIFCAVKAWTNHADKVLSTLCHDFTNRKLFKVEILKDRAQGETMRADYLKKYRQKMGLTEHEASYLNGEEIVSNDTYSPKDETIDILYKDGAIRDIADASDMLNIHVLTKKVEKHFLCYYKV